MRAPPSDPVLPTSPVAFFAENDLLRRGLVTLNAVLASYSIAMLLLLHKTSCRGAQGASFFCDPITDTTKFGSVLRRVHAAFSVFFGLSVWLHQRPRRWFVRWSTVMTGAFGTALVALGVQQLVESRFSAPESRNVVAAGGLLMLLGLAAGAGGAYGGWCYDRRLIMEVRVVVDMVLRVQAQ